MRNIEHRVGRLVYLANARLPTEKAHGYQICKMCEAFASLGLKVMLLHPYRKNPLESKTVFDYYGIRRVFEIITLANWDVVRLNRWFPNAFFALIFFLHALFWGWYAARKAAQEKADLYYTREATIAFWLVRSGLPTVYEAHTVLKRGQRWLLREISHYPALLLVVGLTSFIRDEFIAMGFPKDKIIVLPDGVDLTLFENLPSKKELRRRLELPLDRWIIGYIGRFQTMQMEKGIPELIEAMKHLKPVHGAEPLLLCVGGPMEIVPVYFNLAHRIGIHKDRLKFVDRVPNVEVPYWIHACNIAVMPFPNTEHYAYFMSPLKLFEYMAAAVPIVATNLPSIREVLHHGKNAWLVPPANPQALAKGIQHLLENPPLAKRLAQQARMDVQQYTWERRSAAILQHLLPLQKEKLYR